MTTGVVTSVDRALSAGSAVTVTSGVLEQRVSIVRRDRWEIGDASEVLFVADGSGTLRVGDEEHVLEPATGAFLGRGEAPEVASADGRIDLVIVRTPPAEATGPRVVHYADEAAEEAGIGREFRLLVDSSEATQFVGIIPPGRAKMHNHPYDEVAYLLEGDGILHWADGTSVPVAPGSCIYFPRLVFHSLENLGGAPMRIMGVFTPAGSPADRVEVLDY